MSRENQDEALNLNCEASTTFNVTVKATLASLGAVFSSWLELVNAASNNRVFDFHRLQYFVSGCTIAFLLTIIPGTMYVIFPLPVPTAERNCVM